MCCLDIHLLPTAPRCPVSAPSDACRSAQWLPCRQELMAPISLCGHGASWPCRGANASDAPCLARRTDSRAKIECQNLEERKLKKKMASVGRIRVPRCLRRSLIHFCDAKNLFMNHGKNYNFIILKIRFKISRFFKFLDIKNSPFWLPLAPKGAQC